jgi:hypothetical protein
VKYPYTLAFCGDGWWVAIAKWVFIPRDAGEMIGHSGHVNVIEA